MNIDENFLAAIRPARRSSTFETAVSLAGVDDDDCRKMHRSNAQVTLASGRHLMSHTVLGLTGRPWPGVKHVVVHGCGSTVCCNPTHLSWGTQRHAVQATRVRERRIQAAREALGKAPLSDVDVLDIRRRYEDVEPVKSIETRYGLARPVVTGIGSGQLWSWVKPTS